MNRLKRIKENCTFFASLHPHARVQFDDIHTFLSEGALPLLLCLESNFTVVI